MIALLERWWRAAGLAAAAMVLVYCVGVSTDLIGDDLLGQALGPVALAPDADDGAGDAGPPSADAEFTLAVPTPLEDDRVVAAFAPLVNLSCRRSDYPTAAAAEQPAADVYAAAETAARERALAEPMAPTGSEVDALMTQHLFAAALSPVLALSAPDESMPPANVAVAGGTPAAGACPALLQHTFNRLQTGEPQSLCQFEGKVLVIVNTASYCGNTPQYEGLEAMYRKYKDKGLVVVGFPSNDFGGQEPGTNKEIAEFCRTTYGVQFPMFEKSTVKKGAANPLFVDLIAKTGSAPKWNFHKYVVDRSGTRVVSFSDTVKPDARGLVELVEKLLAEKAPTEKS
jgi:glutathione peroxidase